MMKELYNSASKITINVGYFSQHGSAAANYACGALITITSVYTTGSKGCSEPTREV